MERLQKVMARCGVASRRKCEDLIKAGRVRVNNKKVSAPGFKVDLVTDVITVDGNVISAKKKVYLMLNKPPFFLTSKSDPRGRLTIMDLLPDPYHHLHPVGRLDWDSEGLLLMTNDGELTFIMTHPGHMVTKTYMVETVPTIKDEDLIRLAKGVELEDGVTVPAGVRLVQRGKTARVEISIVEGRNRQVRRMFGVLGYPVYRLQRTAHGGLTLGNLQPGSFRELQKGEIAALMKMKEE